MVELVVVAEGVESIFCISKFDMGSSLLDKCKDRSLEVQLLALLGNDDRPTNGPTNQPTDRQTWEVIGKLNLQ